MDGAALTVLVDSQTRYWEEQKEIQLDDLKPGDRALVQGRFNDQQELAAAGERTFGETG